MDIYKIELPEDVEFILNKIEECGFSTYVIGGAIRTQLINQIHNTDYKIKDYDITTNAKIEDLKSIFNGYSTKICGENYGIFMINMKEQQYEISSFRKDNGYSDNRRPDSVEFINDLKTDCRRRDYRYNTICYNPKEGLIDYFNGIEDIKNKITSCVGNAKDNLLADGLRMMRGVRFNAQLGFKFDLDSFNIIKNNCDLINEISMERICLELQKILISGNSVNGIKELIDLGLMKNIIPEFLECVNYNQLNYHHDLTLDQHIYKVMENLPNNLELQLAGWLHDIGKYKTQTFDDKGIAHYYNHDQVSSQMSIEILKRLKFPNKTIDKVSKLILHHMKYGMKQKGVKRLINILGEEYTRDLFYLLKADRLGRIDVKEKEIKEIDDLKEIFDKINKTKQPVSIKDLDINGNDIINLGVKGVQIGEILNILLDRVMDDPNLNKKDKLIKIALKQISNIPTVYLMSGVPKVGKSTFVESISKNCIICSADRFRENILGEKGNMSAEKLIWKTHDVFYKEILTQKKDVVIDNTNIKNKYRKKYINLAKQYGYKVVGIQLNTSLEVCLERAKQTNFPEEVIFKMYSNYQELKYSEGFDEIKIIKGSEKDEI